MNEASYFKKNNRQDYSKLDFQNMATPNINVAAIDIFVHEI
jgi:hypothetical protein